MHGEGLFFLQEVADACIKLIIAVSCSDDGLGCIKLGSELCNFLVILGQARIFLRLVHVRFDVHGPLNEADLFFAWVCDFEELGPSGKFIPKSCRTIRFSSASLAFVSRSASSFCLDSRSAFLPCLLRGFSSTILLFAV